MRNFACLKVRIFLLLSSQLVDLISAHFVLQSPVSLGYYDVKEATGPCDSFNISVRSNVTDWPSGGYPIHIFTTHPEVVFEFHAALLNDTNTWINIIPPLNQYGVGDFCLPSVPGYAGWAGQDAVMQMVQFAPDGINYQCAAIVFTLGDAAKPDSTCKNSTAVSADIAVGFSSTEPFGSIATPIAAMPTNTASITAGLGMNGNGTTSYSLASRTSSNPAATSSKAVSGAENGFTVHTDRWLRTLLIAVLGAWAL